MRESQAYRSNPMGNCRVIHACLAHHSFPHSSEGGWPKQRPGVHGHKRRSTAQIHSQVSFRIIAEAHLSLSNEFHPCSDHLLSRTLTVRAHRARGTRQGLVSRTAKWYGTHLEISFSGTALV